MTRFWNILTAMTVLVMLMAAPAFAEFAPVTLSPPEGRGVDDLASFLSDIEKIGGVIHPHDNALLVQQAQQDAMRGFWTYQAILSVVFLGGSWTLGLGVIRRGWKVGYTRKANALMLYVLPYVALNGPSPYSNIVTATASLGVFAALLILMSKPFRSRIPPLVTAFASIDRPEDRPFTLTWLLTSVFAVWLIVLAWIWLAPATLSYVFVAFFISGVGDALAEPVGLYFGRHSYRTTALFTDKTYIRTLEGSATVFVSGVVAVLILQGWPMDTQALLALLLFPIVGTLVEAKSPHTWDQPFIIGSCALVAVGLSYV